MSLTSSPPLFSGRGSGGVAAILLSAFVLFAPGHAFAYTFCLRIPDGETVRGFFVTPERKTRLHLYTKPDDGGCRLRHDGGPMSEPFRSAEAAEFVGVCQDPATGRDWALVYLAAGQYADLQFWSVDPVTRELHLEHEEVWTVWGLEEEQREEVVDGAACLVRERQQAQAEFLEAVIALGAGVGFSFSDGGEAGPIERRLDVPVGTSVELSVRAVPEEEVRERLLALSSARPLVATFEGARYVDAAARESWAVIQVLGTRLYEAPGVVLVLDRAKNEWRSIYQVPSGGSESLNFPMLDMVVSGDRLFASLCTDCSSWGNFDDFVIDLRTNRATRIEIAPDFGFEEEGNPPIPEIGAVLGRSDSNP